MHGERGVALGIVATIAGDGVLVNSGELDGMSVAEAKAGIPASRIEFELTETVLMRDLDYATGILAQLREMGVRVAVDDFGTGYSSLAYLRRLAVDTLKIDRSFVSELDDGQGIAIVEAVIGLAHSLGLEVVAEGVETLSQLSALHQRGCNLIQGYLFARPMSIKMLTQALQSGIRMPKGLPLAVVRKDEGMAQGALSGP